MSVPRETPSSASVSRLQDTLTTHGKGPIIEIARLCVDGVMIVGVYLNRVDGCRTNQRIICDYAPSSHVAAAVGRFPYPATNRSQISNDAAVHRRRWIDNDLVDFGPVWLCS